MKLSVLVVTYNQEAFIEETLLSILNQKTSYDFEIIVADDCSTDSTSQIVKELAEKNPNKIVHLRRKQNRGLIGNFFSALNENCNGEYVALCAGDDYWMDEYKIQKQIDFLDNNNNCSIVLTGYRKLYVNGNKFEDISSWNSPLANSFGRNAVKSVIFEEFSFFPVGSSIVFRGHKTKMRLSQCKGLYEDRKIPGEGMILFSIFAESGFFHFLPDVTTVYRVQERSACHFVDNKKAHLFQIKYLMQKIEVADYFGISKVYQYKLSIKFILSYLYSLKNGQQTAYIEALLSCKDISNNNQFLTNTRRILILNKLPIVSKILCGLLVLKRNNNGK